ncbi:hypothetical protein HMPREF9413_5083 [Paenibacillus sp. HGF7]|nr:hypothetical protein HMPREF9413_5083 [Paenibacillus sp. HGF7]
MMVAREAGTITRCDDYKNKIKWIQAKILFIMKALSLDGEGTRCLRSKRA